MNWFEQNKFVGSFLAALALATLLAGYFLLHEKGAAGDEGARLDATMDELARLRRGIPFPNDDNLQKMKAQTEAYRTSLVTLENELKPRSFPIVPMQPNEFQAQLRQSANAVIEKGRASKVQLPENFYLGFDNYATSLPNSAAAPLLGRELKAIEWLTNTVIDAHADALTSLSRAPLAEEKAAPTPPPATVRGGKPAKPANAAPGVVKSDSLDLVFAASPAAARKVLNQIAGAKEQFFVVRTMVVKNPVDKGPPRGETPGAAAASAATPAQPSAAAREGTPAAASVSFIVGTEHINVAAKIEIMQFDIAETPSR